MNNNKFISLVILIFTLFSAQSFGMDDVAPVVGKELDAWSEGYFYGMKVAQPKGSWRSQRWAELKEFGAWCLESGSGSMGNGVSRVSGSVWSGIKELWKKTSPDDKTKGVANVEGRFALGIIAAMSLGGLYLDYTHYGKIKETVMEGQPPLFVPNGQGGYTQVPQASKQVTTFKSEPWGNFLCKRALVYGSAWLVACFSSEALKDTFIGDKVSLCLGLAPLALFYSHTRLRLQSPVAVE